MNRSVKETMLAAAITLISTGTAMIEKDTNVGLILIATGIAVVAIRGYLKGL